MTRRTATVLFALAVVGFPDCSRADNFFELNYNTGTIGTYDLTTGAAVNSSLIAGLSGPYFLAVSGSRLYVGNAFGNGTVGLYDTSGATINASLISGLTNPTGLTISGSNLFVSNFGTNTIGVYNATTGAAVNASFIQDGVNGAALRDPLGLIVFGGNLYVANQTSNTIGVYNATTGATVNAALVSGLSGPQSFAIVGPNLYVANRFNGTIGVYNATTGAVVNASLISGLDNPIGIKISGSNLFVANYSSGKIGVYNASTGAAVNTSFVSGLNGPIDVAFASVVASPGLTVPGGLNGAQQGIANALVNYFNSNGSIPAAFNNLSASGLNQISGSPGASVSQSGIGAITQFANAIFDKSAGGNAQGGGVLGYAEDDEILAYARKKKLSQQATEAYAAVTPKDRIAASMPEGRWGVWSQMYGGVSRTSGDNTVGSNTTNNRIWGIVTGADYRVSADTRVGFAIGGGSTSYGIDNGLGSGKSDMFQLGVYGKHTFGPGYVAGALSYAWQNNTTDRVVTIAGTDNLRANFRSNALAGRIETGWRYATPFVGITPYTALQSTAYFLPSYGETATQGSNQFALNFASKQVTVTRGELGVRWDKAMIVNGGLFTFKARTAWAHDWNSDRSATATFQALGTSFIVNGARPKADAALLSLGGEMQWHNGWSVLASYEGEYSGNTVGNGGKGTVRYQW